MKENSDSQKETHPRHHQPNILPLILLGLTLLITIILLSQKSNLLGHAANTYSLEAESGTLNGNVAIAADPNASGGKYIIFGANPATPNLPAPTTDPKGGFCFRNISPLLGTDILSMNISTTGGYTLWTHMLLTKLTTSYWMQIDKNCAIYLPTNQIIAANSWQWIPLPGVQLAAGNHIFELIGSDVGVKVDKIVLMTDSNCTPTGTGENCLNPQNPTPTPSLVPSFACLGSCTTPTPTPAPSLPPPSTAPISPTPTVFTSPTPTVPTTPSSILQPSTPNGTIPPIGDGNGGGLTNGFIGLLLILLKLFLSIFLLGGIFSGFSF